MAFKMVFMKQQTRFVLIPLAVPFVVVMLFVTVGCKERMRRHGVPVSENFVDSKITEFHNLGWIGAQSHPLTSTLSFPDPNDRDSKISPGGLVIVKMAAGSPVDNAKLRHGNVIVGVEDEWLPIKDDPTLDFIERLELHVATGAKTTKLQVFDGYRCRTIEIQNVAGPLTPNQAGIFDRYQDAANLGLKYLAIQQKADGAFGPEDFDHSLQTTSMAGLSFLASGDQQFQSNVDACLEFVAGKLDAKILSATAATNSDDKVGPAGAKSNPGKLTVMKMPELDLNPLTAACVAQFLAESKVQMIDPQWMPRMMGIVGSFAKSQNENGAWNSTQKIDGRPKLDIFATHTTNQVLLAMGMLERKGLTGNPEAIKRACEFLKQETELRAASSLDRRLKNTLTAGTAAALRSVNCQMTDDFFKRVVEGGLEGVDQCYASPILTVAGVLSTAVLARQTGDDAWAQFHDGTKYWLSSLQVPDGSFQSMPGTMTNALNAENSNADLETAQYCLLLQMQSGKLKKMTAEIDSPMMVSRNSDGEKVEGADQKTAADIPGVPAGAKVMSFSMDDLSGEGSLEEQLKEKLKEMGIEGDIKMGSPGEAPPEEKK
ncbi:MAG: hypothetical protein AB8B55_09225 [Mariniblastus sp.]